MVMPIVNDDGEGYCIIAARVKESKVINMHM